MPHLTPNSDALAALAAGNPDEPVVMLNLLRFRETAERGCGVDGLTGRDAYLEYGRRFAALGPRHGGQVVWMGDALGSIIGPERWDLVLLVRYPTRRQFIGMLRDPDYQAVSKIRQAALADSRLIEMRQQQSAF